MSARQIEVWDGAIGEGRPATMQWNGEAWVEVVTIPRDEYERLKRDSEWARREKKCLCDHPDTGACFGRSGWETGQCQCVCHAPSTHTE